MVLHEALDISGVTDLDQFITRPDNTNAARVRHHLALSMVA